MKEQRNKPELQERLMKEIMSLTEEQAKEVLKIFSSKSKSNSHQDNCHYRGSRL